MTFNPAVQTVAQALTTARGQAVTLAQAVDPARALILNTGRGGNMPSGGREQYTSQSSHIATANTASFWFDQNVGDRECYAYVLDFPAGDGVSVRQFSGFGPHTLTPSVDLTRAICFTSAGFNTSNWTSLNSPVCYFSDASTLQVSSGGAANIGDIRTTVVEFPASVAVQYQSQTFSNTNLFETLTFPNPVNVDQSIAFCTSTAATGTNWHVASYSFAEITSTTQVTIRRQAAFNTVAQTVHCFLVDLGVPVQRQTIVIPAATQSGVMTLLGNPVEPVPWPGGFYGYCQQTPADQNNETCNANAIVNGPKTQVTFERDGLQVASAGATTINAQVVDWKGGAPQPAFKPYFVRPQAVAA